MWGRWLRCEICIQILIQKLCIFTEANIVKLKTESNTHNKQGSKQTQRICATILMRQSAPKSPGFWIGLFHPTWWDSCHKCNRIHTPSWIFPSTLPPWERLPAEKKFSKCFWCFLWSFTTLHLVGLWQWHLKAALRGCSPTSHHYLRVFIRICSLPEFLLCCWNIGCDKNSLLSIPCQANGSHSSGEVFEVDLFIKLHYCNVILIVVSIVLGMGLGFTLNPEKCAEHRCIWHQLRDHKHCSLGSLNSQA